MNGPRVTRDRWVSFGVFLSLIGLWQILSIAYQAEAAPGEPMIAGWQVLFTRTFLSMADYWQGGLGVRSVAEGAHRSYEAAALSLLSHSLYTIMRLVSGLALGGLFGLSGGLAVSWSRWTRRLVELPIQFLRTLPLLAMVPLFQVWFGTAFLGEVLFVAYIIVYAQQFAYLDRMFLVALLFILYTSLSYWGLSRLTARMLAWAPPSQQR